MRMFRERGLTILHLYYPFLLLSKLVVGDQRRIDLGQMMASQLLMSARVIAPRVGDELTLRAAMSFTMMAHRRP
jgi:hypothetical protein